MQQAAKGTALIGLRKALEMDPRQAIRYEIQHLNPKIVRLLEFAGLAKPMVRAEGPYVWDSDGRRYIDFWGYGGALNFGYNHPRLHASLNEVSDMSSFAAGPNVLAGILAHNLSAVAPGELTRVYFGNSGTEATDAAIKMVRAVTGRPGLVSCHGAFHGRSIGALSIMDRADYRKAFEPLLPGTQFVTFGDLVSLEQALARRDVAGFIVEPIQGEGGIVVPPSGYLRGARELCSKYGTLLVIDEVQTGTGRTGRFVACEYDAVVPDCLLIGKALGGGLMPLSALLTTDQLWHEARGDTPCSPFHGATYAGNARACAVGIAALELLFEEDLIRQAENSGNYLLERLKDLQSRQPLISAVRGRGMMIGLELRAVDLLPIRLPRFLTKGYADQLFVGLLIQRLAREHGVITANTLNNPNVLRLQPALNVERDVLDYVVDCLESSLNYLHKFKEATIAALPDIWRFLSSDDLTGAYE
jgi:putrescine aminotransferase